MDFLLVLLLASTGFLGVVLVSPISDKASTEIASMGGILSPPPHFPGSLQTGGFVLPGETWLCPPATKQLESVLGQGKAGLPSDLSVRVLGEPARSRPALINW